MRLILQERTVKRRTFFTMAVDIQSRLICESRELFIYSELNYITNNGSNYIPSLLSIQNDE
jgi:hypothetical protein